MKITEKTIALRMRLEESGSKTMKRSIKAPSATQHHVKSSFLKKCIARVKWPNDQAQRPPPETPGRLQRSRTNYLNRPTAQRGGGSLQRSG
jgi:hypothetical protein